MFSCYCPKCNSANCSMNMGVRTIGIYLKCKDCNYQGYSLDYSAMDRISNYFIINTEGTITDELISNLNKKISENKEKYGRK